METSHEDGPVPTVTPTYDSRRTGPRYRVTSRVGARTIEHKSPVPDPFIRTTVYLGTRDLLAGLWRNLTRRDPLTVTVIVDGDDKIVSDVMELDANFVGWSRITRPPGGPESP